LSIKIVCQNKKAFHDYFIEERFEAGMVLVGTEVKSLRLSRANMRDSYASVHKEELYLSNMHISPYSQADKFTQPEPLRKRKLLVHKKEILRLIGKTREKGLTLIPTKIYFKNGKAKIEIGLAKGKKQYDKRETIRRKDVEREMARAMKRQKS
jgi:SsrA-binding protein